MIRLIKKWIGPPVFKADERKTIQARIMNIMRLLFAGALAMCALVLIPFFAVHKLESYAVVLALALLTFIGRLMMFRGHLKAVSAAVLIPAWLVFFGNVVISGGALSPLLVRGCDHRPRRLPSPRT